MQPECSHSLGKLIEWKHKNFEIIAIGILSSHSLGKLIEWKPNCSVFSAL